jgi:D-glycero-D-manno-heptose 1,7-bisphosphate phosphatase
MADTLLSKAIFLDRDGVIIRERGDYSFKPDHIELVGGIAEALMELKKKGFIFIVITNQGGIEKGMYSHRRLKAIHKDLKEFFAGFGIRILEFYYCPHHPDFSNCICRKPDSQMLEKAIARYNIDPARSWFIGDTERDIIAGKKAGVNTLLIEANSDLRGYVKDIT